MDALDLNLIPYLVALDDTRNVSRAGDLLGVSQPRVSTALGRLREYFGDPLFVRTSRGMEPTPRALALLPAARDALAQIERGLVAPHDFDPAASTHTFSIALSDVGEIVFLPKLLQAFATRAHANLRSVSLAHDEVGRGSRFDRSRGGLLPGSRRQQLLPAALVHAPVRVPDAARPSVRAGAAVHGRAVPHVRARGGARRRPQPRSAREISREAAHAAPRSARDAALHEPAVHPEPHRPDRDGPA